MSKSETKKNQKKKNFEIPKYPFIKYLEKFAEKKNRGALAALRRGLQYDLGKCIGMFPYVVPWLSNVRSKWERDMYYLIASLFAYHPISTGIGNLGDIFRVLYLKRQKNPSFEKRFITLLKSNPEDVPFHIRQAISLAKSENIPINWYELFFDLLRWNNPNYPPYEKWAQSFWRDKKEE